MTDPRHKRYFAGCYNCAFLENHSGDFSCTEHKGITYYGSGNNTMDDAYDDGVASVIYICNDWKKKETGNVPPTYFMNGF